MRGGAAAGAAAGAGVLLQELLLQITGMPQVDSPWGLAGPNRRGGMPAAGALLASGRLAAAPIHPRPHGPLPPLLAFPLSPPLLPAEKLRKLSLDGSQRFPDFEYDVEADIKMYEEMAATVLPFITDTVHQLNEW